MDTVLLVLGLIAVVPITIFAHWAFAEIIEKTTGGEASAKGHLGNFRSTPFKKSSARHAARQSVLAAPDRVSILTREENEFFFLHEIELHARMELQLNQRGEVEVTPRQFKKLENYLAMAPSTNPYEAFAHHGIALRVTATR